MNTKAKIGLGAVAVVALAGAGTGIGFAFNGADDEVAGPAPDQVRAAAVQAVPGSTASEVDNDGDH